MMVKKQAKKFPHINAINDIDHLERYINEINNNSIQTQQLQKKDHFVDKLHVTTDVNDDFVLLDPESFQYLLQKKLPNIQLFKDSHKHDNENKNKNKNLSIKHQSNNNDDDNEVKVKSNIAKIEKQVRYQKKQQLKPCNNNDNVLSSKLPLLSDQYRPADIELRWCHLKHEMTDILTRLEQQQWPSEAMIDLHHHTLEQARKKVTNFILQSFHQRKKCVTIITGIGQTAFHNDFNGFT
jgi:DNA-nicking Smr family endonuclease